MKRSNIAKSAKILLPATAVLLVTANFILAQTQSGGEGLSLSLEPTKESVVLGEPVYVTARLRNTGSEELQLATDLNPAAGFLTVEIIGPDNAERRFVPLAIADLELQPRTLPPGSEFAAVFQVFFGGRGWTFGETGSYRLSATLSVQPGPSLLSEKVTIKVQQGDGAGRFLVEASAEDLEATGKFLVWQRGDHLRRAHATLEEIIVAYPESPIADYAQLAIGLNLSQPFHDYSLGRVRPSRPDEAQKWLQEANPEVLPKVLRIQRGLGMARVYLALDGMEDARSALGAARKEAAGDKALEKMIEMELEVDAALQKAN